MPRMIVLAGRLLLVLTLAAVAYLSLTPVGQVGPDGWDKVEHALAYAAVAFFLMLSVKGRVSRIGTMITLVLLTIAYGVALEYVQRLVGRDFDVLDMAADAVGAVTGTIVGFLARRWIGIITARRS